jgi:hypothetical protein
MKGTNHLETEKTLASVWDQHVGAEFSAKSADQAVATMTAESYVGHADTALAGGMHDAIAIGAR